MQICRPTQCYIFSPYILLHLVGVRQIEAAILRLSFVSVWNAFETPSSLENI